jgi:hypothetical protein
MNIPARRSLSEAKRHKRRCPIAMAAILRGGIEMRPGCRAVARWRVAQTFSLAYRRLLVGRAGTFPAVLDLLQAQVSLGLSRLKTCGTAD